jgi:putative transposase
MGLVEYFIWKFIVRNLMRDFNETNHRRSIRLQKYDYSREGAYFITICTHNRECIFGEIVGSKMLLNDWGKMVRKCWTEIPAHQPNIALDEFIIMPNHIHGIIFIHQTVGDYGNIVGVQYIEPLHNHNSTNNHNHTTHNEYQHIIPGSIGVIIRGFKSAVTKWSRQNETIHTVWQRNYYEHIIRNDSELNRIREYIQNNPLKWELDKNNPMQMRF